MQSCRSCRRKMHLRIFLLLASMVVRSSQLSLNDCTGYIRRPEVTDISVECGTSSIGLAIQMCPVVYTGYNVSQLILNGNLNPECRGIVDETVDPPVVRFNFPLNNSHSCQSIFRTTSSAGTGVFSDFSNIQTVNISGSIRSSDPTTGSITYNAELKYYYSCAYPLEYLINNTQIDVSASSIAVKDNNGSFISTLSLELFSDPKYTRPLVVPKQGLELRSKVYVEVKATNLTDQYNVLLDRCYASISPLPTNSSFFNLFVPCSKDHMTTLIENGDSQSARFSFPAFRFLEQQNEKVSTYYLHCITRLCEFTTCSTFKQCNRKKRSAPDAKRSAPDAIDVSEVHTLTSKEISTRSEDEETKAEPLAAGERGEDGDNNVGLGAAVGVLAFVTFFALCIAAVFYKRLRN